MSASSEYNSDYMAFRAFDYSLSSYTNAYASSPNKYFVNDGSPDPVSATLNFREDGPPFYGEFAEIIMPFRALILWYSVSRRET